MPSKSEKPSRRSERASDRTPSAWSQWEWNNNDSCWSRYRVGRSGQYTFEDRYDTAPTPVAAQTIPSTPRYNPSTSPDFQQGSPSLLSPSVDSHGPYGASAGQARADDQRAPLVGADFETPEQSSNSLPGVALQASVSYPDNDSDYTTYSSPTAQPYQAFSHTSAHQGASSSAYGRRQSWDRDSTSNVAAGASYAQPAYGIQPSPAMTSSISGQPHGGQVTSSYGFYSSSVVQNDYAAQDSTHLQRPDRATENDRGGSVGQMSQRFSQARIREDAEDAEDEDDKDDEDADGNKKPRRKKQPPAPDPKPGVNCKQDCKFGPQGPKGGPAPRPPPSGSSNRSSSNSNPSRSSHRSSHSSKHTYTGERSRNVFDQNPSEALEETTKYTFDGVDHIKEDFIVWNKEYETWKDVTCACGFGYYTVMGEWISGEAVRGGKAPPKPAHTLHQLPQIEV